MFCQILYCPHCRNALAEMPDMYLCQSCGQSYPIVDGIPSFVDQNTSMDSFDASAFEFLFGMEERHFWHVGRREIILDALRTEVLNVAKSRMLEVGCGNGSVLGYLKQNGVSIEGGDIFLEGLRFCRRRVPSAVLYHIDLMALLFRNEFDVIGIFDVLEHVDDDERALVEIRQALKPGGKLILTVPAHEWLWSAFDVTSHHKRRYSKRELVGRLERTGFDVNKASFYVFFLFPVLAAIRLLGNIWRGTRRADRNNRTPSYPELQTVPLVNEVLLGLLRLERLLLRHTGLPCGASLLVVAQKKQGAS